MITSDLFRRIVTALQCGDPRCECHRDPKPGRNGPTVRVHCPAHDDPHPDLTVTDQRSQRRPLLHCHSQKCSQEAVIDALRAMGAWGDEMDWRHETVSSVGDRPVYYVYVDEHGQPLHRSERRGSGQMKQISQQFLTAEGRWVKRAPTGQRYVLFRLPELIATPTSETICLAEGEKNVEDLHAFGFTATTNSMGALNWRKEYNHHFKDRLVAMFEDNDERGRQRSELIAPQLTRAGAVVKVVRLPELGPSEDVSDWIAGGGTKEQLEAIIDEVPIWTPPPLVDPEEIDRELDALLLTERDDEWTFRREGDDFQFHFRRERLRVRVDHLHEHSDGWTGELLIETATHGHLHWGRHPLSSLSTREGLTKKLARVAQGIDWDHVLEQVCFTVVREVRRGEPELVTTEIPLTPIQHGISPFVELNGANGLYGFGASGKSLLAGALLLSAVSGVPLPGGIRPHSEIRGAGLFVDYESTGTSFRRRIGATASSLSVPDALEQI